MEDGEVQIAICTEDGAGGWNHVFVRHLDGILRRTFDQLVREDVVAQAVESLEAGVNHFAAAMALFPAAIERTALILGIADADALVEQDTEEGS